MKATISIVIRTFNSACVLPSVLSKLQLTNGDEIIIVDSGSQDATLAVAKSFNCRILHLPPPFSYGKALNLGFGAANNSWVLALSSHSIPISPNYLNEWRKAIQTFSENTGAAFGPLLFTSKSLSKIDHAVPRQFNTVKAWMAYGQFLGGNSNGIYRKDFWWKYPFNETLSSGEDWDWLMNAEREKYITVLVPEAAVLYRNQGTLRYMFVKGRHDGRIAREILNAKKMSLLNLCIGNGSLAKKFILRQIPLNSFLRQSAHCIGYFFGSRHVS
jgi:glycosyltransferase involved in cell wall biosynthesis